MFNVTLSNNKKKNGKSDEGKILYDEDRKQQLNIWIYLKFLKDFPKKLLAFPKIMYEPLT